MAKADPLGYKKRQSNASKLANEKMKKEGKGVWNPKTHIIIERNKRINGTSLSNVEFRKNIGCNGNSPEVIQRQKELKIGIFSSVSGVGSYDMWSFDCKVNCNVKCNNINICNFKNSKLKNKFGYCKDYVHSWGLKTRFKNKNCKKCGVIVVHIGDRCYNCNPWEMTGFESKECNNKDSGHFGLKVLHIGDRCFKCRPWKISGGGGSFNREKFYSSKFDLIDFEYSNKKISWENIDPLNGVPGVWAVWSIDNKCLDVCQTQNIGVEMKGWIRNYYANKGKSDEELIEMNRRYQNYNRKKKRDIAKHCSDLNSKPIFKVVATDITSKSRREAIEAQYAYNFKSLFWNPAPGGQNGLMFDDESDLKIV